MVKLLLENNANVGVKNSSGKSAMNIAVDALNLVERGTNIWQSMQILKLFLFLCCSVICKSILQKIVFYLNEQNFQFFQFFQFFHRL